VYNVGAYTFRLSVKTACLILIFDIMNYKEWLETLTVTQLYIEQNNLETLLFVVKPTSDAARRNAEMKLQHLKNHLNAYKQKDFSTFS
jgi:hypothetical protein